MVIIRIALASFPKRKSLKINGFTGMLPLVPLSSLGSVTPSQIQAGDTMETVAGRSHALCKIKERMISIAWQAVPKLTAIHLNHMGPWLQVSEGGQSGGLLV